MARKATTVMRRCIGSSRFGIEPHEAPVSEFPVQPSQKDGLGRMCKPHWRTYTNGLRKDALARSATEAEPERAPEGGTERKGRARSAERPAKADTGARSRPRAKRAAQPEKLTEAEATPAATEALGSTEYTDAVGSDAVQAALEVASSGGEA
jgi:hypothetical protein